VVRLLEELGDGLSDAFRYFAFAEESAISDQAFQYLLHFCGGLQQVAHILLSLIERGTSGVSAIASHRP